MMLNRRNIREEAKMMQEQRTPPSQPRIESIKEHIEHQRDFLSPPNIAPEHHHPHECVCSDVYRHVSKCPVCYTLYKNSDRIYWIVIIALLIIIALLLREKL